jgi:(1->4)-alpha-D-glucan 1-alpha-D-glucosylmutase
LPPLRVPGATYRIQFNRGFRFADARALVPYLHALGVTDLYASPLLQAREGSAHGYDVTDPARLNRELGDEEAFAELTAALQQHEMGLLLDIVPNHMAASTENPWWADVLQNGPASPYAAWFDIDWRPWRPGLTDKVLLPVLGAPYGRELETQKLSLVLEEDGFFVRYYDKRFPLKPASYAGVLSHRLEELVTASGKDHPAVPAFMELIELFRTLPAPDKDDFASAFRQAVRRLRSLYHTQPRIRDFLEGTLQSLNGRQDDPRSFDTLDRLLAQQHYRLAFWRAAHREINYRRFFDISDLVSVRVEEENVFAATHARILQLAAAGSITGLRIDHIDGLLDPEGYLRRLQEHLGAAGAAIPFYIVAEKILANGEALPPEWPVSGTTGYDFLNAVNGLFCDRRGAGTLDETYRRFGGVEEDFSAVVYARKRQVLEELFPGEVRRLAWQLSRLAEQDRHGCDLTLPELEQAVIEVTAWLPVYRTYIRNFHVTARDRRYVERAVTAAVERTPAAGPACAFLRRVLLLEFPDHLPAEGKREWLRFAMRWQQLTGPVMAKGYEDTALYVYNRLVSLNEVGGNPQTAGVSVAEFHARNRAVQERGPHTLNATSTHDTKRSEDVRARINVLSEIPGLWAEKLSRWRDWNHSRKPVVDGRPVPDGNMELLIYQTLVGAWPLSEGEVPAFKERLQTYLVKAAREAKTHTSWLNPRSEYEDALTAFATAILEPGEDNLFLRDFLEFQKIAAFFGALNSLAQVLLKITAPGVPDFYQGTELWNLSLVDPDNRRPVDFKTRAELLAALQEREAHGLPLLVQELLETWEDGRVKLYLTYKALHFRRANRELFAAGEYLPVEVTKPGDEHACAFARRLGDRWVLVAVPRLPVRLQEAGRATPAEAAADRPPVLKPPLGEAAWGETSLILPENSPDRWHNVLTGEALAAALPAGTASGSKILPLACVFRSFPAALLAGN